MSSFALIRSQVEHRIPGAIRKYDRSRGAILQTGIPALDMYGVRTGELTQICASPEASSGKTSVLVSLFARVTASDHFCALIDATDCFDPGGAEDAGVKLSRLLWVRCGGESSHDKKPRLKPLEQAFKAADILVQNGGFELIAVDLGGIDEQTLRKVPLTTWFRFARVVEKTESALVFLAAYPAAQSCAGLTLNAEAVLTRWEGTHAKFLRATDHALQIGRQRNHKPPQSVKPRFQATPKWA